MVFSVLNAAVWLHWSYEVTASCHLHQLQSRSFIVYMPEYLSNLHTIQP